MTKDRAPATMDAALTKIASQFERGFKDLPAIVGRDVATIYRWADPDGDISIPMDCAIKLEIAYRRAGGIGSPILAAFKAQLAIADRDQVADRDELARLAVIALKESTESTAAHIACTQPGATADDWRTAIRETEEAIVAKQDTLALLRRGAGPTGGVERDTAPREGEPT